LRGGTISSASEIVAQVLSQALQVYFSRMVTSGRVSAASVMTRVVAHASTMGVRLSEFRDIMLSMLREQEQDRLTREVLVRDVLRHEVLMLQRQRQASHQKAMVYRTDVARASVHVRASASASSSSSSSSSSPSSSSSSSDTTVPTSTVPQKSPTVQFLHETLLRRRRSLDNDGLDSESHQQQQSQQDQDPKSSTSRRRYAGPTWKIRQLQDMRSMDARAREYLVSLEPVTCLPPSFDASLS
jgi:hypothetical protein